MLVWKILNDFTYKIYKQRCIVNFFTTFFLCKELSHSSRKIKNHSLHRYRNLSSDLFNINPKVNENSKKFSKKYIVYKQTVIKSQRMNSQLIGVKTLLQYAYIHIDTSF